MQDSLTEQGRALLHDFDDDSAHDRGIALLQQAVANGERDAPRWLAIGYMERGRLEDATDLLAPIVHSGRRDLALLLADILDDLGEDEAAEANFRIAVEEGDPGAANNYAVFLRSRDRYREAMPLLERAAEGGDILAPGNLAEIYLVELDDPEKALEIAKNYASESKPKTYSTLARIYRHLGNMDEAERFYRRAIEFDAPNSQQNYADFLENVRRDPAGSREHLWAAKEADEGGWGYALGSFLLRQGDDDEAASVLADAAYWGDLQARELLDEEFEDVEDE